MPSEKKELISYKLKNCCYNRLMRPKKKKK